jgi:hypothetical protein
MKSREPIAMIRVLLTAAALAAFCLGSRAEGTVVQLRVQPMPAPQPALKYQLLPEVRELTPGNPIQWYIRCFAEQRNFFFSKQGVAQRNRYLSMSLAELQAQKYQGFGGNALTQADWGARLDAPDWQVVQRVQTDGMELILPELEPLRVLGLSLRVRFRIEAAARRFDDAVVTAKTMFALARHLGEYPAEAGNEVGMAIANLALDTLEEMVQQPGCPNLYWALTDLPSPVVDVRKGLQGAQAIVAAEMRPLRHDAPMTEAALEEFVSRLSGAIGFSREQEGRSPRNLRVGLKARADDADRVREARSRILGGNLAQPATTKAPPQLPGALAQLVNVVGLADRVRAFPPMQVILLDEKREYEIQRDEGMKLLALAPWQIDVLCSGQEPGRGGDGLLKDFLPRVIKVRRAQGRLEQRIALLRYVAALRIYAAEHDGKMPLTLTDIALPLPADPFTGKPFQYTAQGLTAHLRGGSPRGEEKNPAYNLQYEVRLEGGAQASPVPASGERGSEVRGQPTGGRPAPLHKRQLR